MTENLPAERKPQLVAGAPVAALVPQTMEEAFRLSTALAASGMAPRGIDKPEQIMVAIMAGAELGLAPFQSLQSFAVVNGRPTLWGDGLMAVVRARGVRVKEWLDGEGEAMVAHCVATRPDTGEEIARQFTVADAKKAGLWGKQGPWQQYPKRMLQMRARALALRDGCADMLRGVQVREEVEDYVHVREVSTPQPSGIRARLAAHGDKQAPGFSADHVEAQIGEPPAAADVTSAMDEILDGDFVPAHDAETGEIIEAHLPAEDDAPDSDFPGDRPAGETVLASDSFDAASWAIDFNQEVHRLTTVEAIKAAWADAKTKGYVLKLKAHSPAKLKALTDSMDARVAEIEGGE